MLSKTLGPVLLPTNFLIGVGLVGAILLATRWASLGRKLMVASVVLLAICGSSPLGRLLLYPLESRFPPWDAARGAPDGIIVLGGSIDADLSAVHGVAVTIGGAERPISAGGPSERFSQNPHHFFRGSSEVVSRQAGEGRK